MRHLSTLTRRPRQRRQRRGMPHAGLFRYYAAASTAGQAAAVTAIKKAGLQVGIRAAIDDPTTLELYFLDDIYDTIQFDYWTGELYETSMVQEVIDRVKYAQPSRIICYIDSLGGDIAIAMAIYNFLKRYPAKVEVEILAMAASSATVIAMAANKGKLRMARNAFFIIHKAWGAGMGNADDLREAADIIDRYTAQMVDIYAQRTGKTVEEINGLIADGDYWQTGQEAMAAGFVDELINEVQPTIQVNARLQSTSQKFSHVPAALLQAKPGQGQGAAAATKPAGQVQPDEEPITTETGAQEGGIIDFFKKELMNLKNIVSAALGKKPAGAPGAAAAGQQQQGGQSGTETTTTTEGGEAGDDASAQAAAIPEAVQAVLEPVLGRFAAELDTEIKADLGALETRIKADLDKKYGKQLQDLQEANNQLTQEIQASAGAETTTTGGSAAKRIVGKFHAGAAPAQA